MFICIRVSIILSFSLSLFLSLSLSAYMYNIYIIYFLIYIYICIYLFIDYVFINVQLWHPQYGEIIWAQTPESGIGNQNLSRESRSVAHAETPLRRDALRAPHVALSREAPSRINSLR